MTLPVFRSAGTLGAVITGNVTPGMPAGWAADDIALMEVMTNAGNTFPTISGWTNLGLDINSANQSTAWYWRRLVAGDSAPAFTIASGTALDGTTGLFARIYTFSDCLAAGTPFEDATVAGAPTSSTTPQTAEVTTTDTDRLIVSLLMFDNNLSWASGMPPSGWANIGGILTSAAGNDAMSDAISINKATAGTQAAATIGTLAASGSMYWTTLTLALLPAPDAIVITLGQATETDIAQPFGRVKQATIGQATETDLAQAFTVGRGVTLGQTLETDTAGVLTPSKVGNLGQALETDIAQPFHVGRRVRLWAPTGAELLDGRHSVVTSTVRFEVVDVDDNLIGICHPRLGTGIVAWDSSAAIQRTLTGLQFAPSEHTDIRPGSDRIRPILVLSTGDEYPAGTLLFNDGPHNVRTTGDWVACDPMPDLSWWLDQKLPESISYDGASVLTDVLARICDLHGITEAQRLIVPSSAVAGDAPGAAASGEAKGSEVAATICDLLGYLPPHTNNQSLLVFRPVPRPADDAPDHRYHPGQNGRVIADSIIYPAGIAERPNLYIARSTSPDSSVSARYEVPASAPNSRANIHHPITKLVSADGYATDAQAYAALEALARRDSAKVRTVTFAAKRDPRHDAYGIVDWEGERMLEQAWSLPLAGGAMEHTLTGVYEDSA